MTKHTLSVLVDNAPGVLARISGLFARRGFNIDSLAVGETENPHLSRITIVVEVESQSALEQITKQLNKLVEVIKIVELDATAVQRQLILVKVAAPEPAARREIIDIVGLFRGNVVDVHADTLVIEATGRPDKLEALMDMLEPYGIRELVQSGLVAVGRGPKALSERPARASKTTTDPNNK